MAGEFVGAAGPEDVRRLVSSRRRASPGLYIKIFWHQRCRRAVADAIRYVIHNGYMRGWRRQ